MGTEGCVATRACWLLVLALRDRAEVVLVLRAVSVLLDELAHRVVHGVERVGVEPSKRLQPNGVNHGAVASRQRTGVSCSTREARRVARFESGDVSPLHATVFFWFLLSLFFCL